jgi:hypothetical protein
MASLASQRPELRVVADQVGAPTSAAVVAEGLARILAAPAGELSARFAAAHGVVHLTAAGATSWHGFATGIVQASRRAACLLKPSVWSRFVLTNTLQRRYGHAIPGSIYDGFRRRSASRLPTGPPLWRSNSTGSWGHGRLTVKFSRRRI